MRRYRFIQTDVFTNVVFSGNPLAVYYEAEGLSDEEMQQIAREMNLSETTFVFPPTAPNADVWVRFFTPSTELPFAGYPTIGTHLTLAHLGVYELTGPVTRVLPAKQRVQILLDVMGRSTAAELSLEFVLFKKRDAANLVLNRIESFGREISFGRGQPYYLQPAGREAP